VQGTESRSAIVRQSALGQTNFFRGSIPKRFHRVLAESARRLVT